MSIPYPQQEQPARLEYLPDDQLQKRQAEIQARCLHPHGGYIPFPREEIAQSIPVRFEKQVVQFPHHLAVTTAGQQLTYEELNQAANRIARLILERCGNDPAPVALLLEHGMPTITALLGVLKAGKPYVALDPAFPTARTSYIMADTQANILISNSANWTAAGKLVQSRAELLNIDTIDTTIPSHNLDQAISPDALAYIIYTSGSTGQPKGVYQSHRNLLHNIMQYINTLHLSHHDRFTLLYSCSVNGSLRDIFGALLVGASLHTFDVKTKGLADLSAWLQKEEITFYHSVPTVFRHFIDTLTGTETFPHVRLIRFGGERVPAQYIDWYKKYFPDSCILYAGMGATETSTVRQCFIDKETVIKDGVVPTGFPVDEREVILLDDDGQAVAPGEVGTIAVRSKYLALGYWRRPELTKATFLPDPQGGEERIYVTGDLGCILDDGRLIHTGRQDAQVKVRGYRVELAEIEKALLKESRIKEAAAAAHPNGQDDHTLAAYIVTHPHATLTASDLHKFLKQQLPDYMLPATYTFLDQMPQTDNGKINRRELPVPELLRPDLDTPFITPQTATQTKLATIWVDVLGTYPIGVHDDFFLLGGHSLSATRVISRLRDTFQIDIPLSTLFAAPTIAELEVHIEQAQTLRETLSIQPLPRPSCAAATEAFFPASFSQYRLWFLDQMNPGATTFYRPLVLRLSGLLNISALEESLEYLCQRHETLRTTFVEKEGHLLQRVHLSQALPLQLVDLRDLQPKQNLKVVRQVIQQAAEQPFDLARGSLIRATLYKLADLDHVLLLTLHHIITDGWSMDVLRQELLAVYEAIIVQAPPSLPALSIQYADFAAWQWKWLDSEMAQQQVAYWQEKLQGSLPNLTLPTDRSRPSHPTDQGATLRLMLPSNLTDALRQLSQNEGVTLNMTLLAAFKSLLYRYTGQEDMLLGASIANRVHAETESIVGFFVNTLLLRTDISGNPTFRELLKRVRQVCLGAYANQELPVEKVIELIQPHRDQSGTFPFPVLFVFQNTPGKSITSTNLTVERLRVDLDRTKFDLTLIVTEREAGLECAFEYSTHLFEEATITRVFTHFQTLLSGAVSDPALPLQQLPLLPVQEQAQLARWGQPETVSLPYSCIHHWVAVQAKTTPQKTAVCQEDRQLTYAELEARTNKLAHHLQRIGVGPDSLVGLHVPRSVEMIVGMLGILKAGGAYLPLDPTYPDKRLQLMINDARPVSILTTVGLPFSPSVTPQIINLATIDLAGYPNSPPVDLVSADNLAYVIYTSGSTGRPKGVMIEHQALVHFVQAAATSYPITGHDRVLQFASVAFDAAVEEIYPTLVQGGTLVLRSETMLDSIPTFLKKCATWGITVLDLPTAFWHRLADSLFSKQVSLPKDVRLVIIGGEKADQTALNQWQQAVSPSVRLLNTYGPTEATVVATVYDTSATEPIETVSNGVLIGHPLPGVHVVVLDATGQPVPTGVPGELYVGGPSLARGYLNRPDLTEISFLNLMVPLAAKVKQRWYKTGDLVRFLSNGNLEFLGRIDDQVKIRGYRIELGEIETVLAQHPAVQTAVVTIYQSDDGDKQLAAYAVLRQEISALELRDHLQARLPAYMAPASFTFVDQLPLLPNGKINRKALPRPAKFASISDDIVLPRTDLEETVAQLWTELLNVPQVGIYDNFFDLGGHSLKAIQVISRLQATCRVKLTVRDLFDAPTVADLSARILELGSTLAQDRIAMRSRPRQLPLSYAQERIWILDQIKPDSTANNIPIAYQIIGSLDVNLLEQSFTRLIHRHEILRTVFSAGDEYPQQYILPAKPWLLDFVDLTHLPEGQRDEALAVQIDKVRNWQFNLAEGPLLHACLIRLARHEHTLALVFHHIISDGWSISRLSREISTIYTSLFEGREPELPTLPLQYADYALWQREWLQSAEAVHQLDYWKERLANATPLLELPLDYPRSAFGINRSGQIEISLPVDLSNELKNLSRRNNASLFMTMLAAFKLLLYRLCGQSDISVGSPIANRNKDVLENIIGIFLNHLVLRTDLADTPTFLALLNQVRQVALNAYANQDIPFEKLLDALPVDRNLEYTPLFQVYFNMLNTGSIQLHLPDIHTRRIHVNNSQANFDLTIYVTEYANCLRLRFFYNADLFNRPRILELTSQYQQLMTQIVAEPEKPLTAYSLFTNRARNCFPDPMLPLQDTWMGTVHEQFSQQAKQHPNHLSVIDDDERCTYATLETRSNQLAHYLLDQGIRKGDVVAVYAHRSACLVWAWLGIHKAGAAFVNLDPAYPPERLRHYLDVAQPNGLIIVEAAGDPPSEVTGFSQMQVQITLPRLAADNPFAQYPTDSPGVSIGPDDTAYIAFTSGSTGFPKGVRGRHGPLSHFLPWQAETFDLTIADRFSMLSGLSHDPLQRDIFTALWVGGTICIPDPEQVGNLNYLAVWMKRVQITFAHMTPPMCQILTETAPPDEILPHLRYVFFVGDKLTRQEVEKLRKLAPHTTAINSYGSTETQRAVSYHLLPPGKTVSEQIPKLVCPLGKGMPDVQVLVLTKHKLLAGIGELGEIYMRSPHLAGGYIDDPVLTEAKFVRNPFTNLPGDRLYRTGDLGRYRPDGTVEFAGRVDRQIKIRGFRVEPGEIENALSKHPDIQKAVVMVRDDLPGGRGLVAYLVSPNAGDLYLEVYRTYLASQFPDYMIPTVLIPVADIPLTPNGKIDYGALPEPDVSHMLATRQYAPPQGITEQRLAEIWQSLLEIEAVGRHDNFFELGGHSLLAIRLFTQIEQTFAQKIPVTQLFQSPTIASLSKAIYAENTTYRSNPLITIKLGGSKPPVFLVHGFGGGVVGYGELARLLGPEQPVYGLQARGVDGVEESDTAVEVMAARYIDAIRVVQPHGPYYVGGYCYGGVIAFEIARQLEVQDEHLGLVAIFEGYAPLRGGNRESMWRSPRLMLNFIRNMPYWLFDYLALGRQQMKWRLKRKLRRHWKKFVRKFGVSVSWGAEDVIDDTSHLPAKQRLLMETHIRAMGRYDPGVFNGSVTLFRVRSQSLSRITDFSMGWNKLATGGVYIKMIDGSHHNILEQPYVRTLASQLQSSIEETKS